HSPHCTLPSFPTRRSSDLGTGEIAGGFGNCDFGSFVRIEIYVSRVAINGEGDEFFESRTGVPPVQIRSGAGVPPVNPIVSPVNRSEEHTSELQSRVDLVCR